MPFSKKKQLRKVDDTNNNNNTIGNITFPDDNAYTTVEGVDPVTNLCNTPYYINYDENTSPGYFIGGCPGPVQLLGTFGPGLLYSWVDLLTQGNLSQPLASLHNIFGLSNGVAMIHWDENNLDSSLRDKYTQEMLTGWGTFPDKKIANDYGWVNGVIFNFLDKFQVAFIHIWFRNVTGVDDDGNETSDLYFWEAVIPESLYEKTEELYNQLRNHIDKYFDLNETIIHNKTEVLNVPSPLSEVIESVFYMKIPGNNDIPNVPSKYWTKNTKYPENNIL